MSEFSFNYETGFEVRLATRNEPKRRIAEIYFRHILVGTVVPDATSTIPIFKCEPGCSDLPAATFAFTIKSACEALEAEPD